LPRGSINIAGELRLPLTLEKTHILQQYVVGMIYRICAQAPDDVRSKEHPFIETAMFKHPEYDLAVLPGLYGNVVAQFKHPSEFQVIVKPQYCSASIHDFRTTSEVPKPTRRTDDPGHAFLIDASKLLKRMLDDGFTPRSEEFAGASGYSWRNVQHNLGACGYTFHNLPIQIRGLQPLERRLQEALYLLLRQMADNRWSPTRWPTLN
jgi:hypothetical protein